MGNDGGSIPTRRELVKEASRAKTTAELWDSTQKDNAYHWTFCPLSKRPLSSPVVSDSIGRLFNKDAILEWLINPEQFGDGAEVLKAGGVKSLKDVVNVKFEISEDDKNGTATTNGNGAKKSLAGKTEIWICPMSRKELGPGSRAVYLIPCGHAFTQGAIEEIKDVKCLVCSEPFEKSNIIVINPTKLADIERLKSRTEDLLSKGLSHSLKKSSKKRKNKDGAENGAAKASKSSTATPSDLTSAKPTIQNTVTADVTAKVMAHEQERTKRRKMEMTDNVKSLFTSSNGSKPSGNRDFMSRGFTIPTEKKLT